MPINRINPFMNFDGSPDMPVGCQVFKTENLTHFPIKQYQWVRRERYFYRRKYQ